MLSMLAAFNYREGGLVKALAKQLVLTAAGVSVVVLPVLAYFSFNHALAGLYDIMVVVPKYLSKGGWGRQFPNMFHLLGDPEKNPYDTFETLLAYWPITFYVVSVFFCIALFLRKRFDNRTILFFGIAVLGGVVFQRVFGIYSLLKARYALYPALILAVGYADMAWLRGLQIVKCRTVSGRRTEIILYALFLLFVCSGLYGYSHRRAFLPSKPPLAYRSTLSARGKYAAIDIPRAENIHIPPAQARKVAQVVKYIKQNTQPGEPIFVFPYSPMYYFLTNRPSATRHPPIYSILRKTREEIVRELDDRKINYVIYVQESFVWGISAEAAFPEIVDYLNEEYQPISTFQDTVVLVRKDQFMPPSVEASAEWHPISQP
jgi:hypothetical protein